MAVTFIGEQLMSRQASDTLNNVGFGAWRPDREYTLKYDVYTDDDSDDASTIRGATGGSETLPVMGDVYPTDSDARCYSVKYTQVEKLTAGGHKYEVECNFKSYFEFDPTSLQANPLLRPPIYSSDGSIIERAVTKDLDGFNIQNSAKTPFLPPLVVSLPSPTLEISWNQASLTIANMSAYQDCYNSDGWNGFAAQECLLKRFTWQQVWENNLKYYAMKATVQILSLGIDPDGWKYTKLLDQGFYENVPGVGRRMILATGGLALPEPSMLDGTGLVKADAADPYYIFFRMRRPLALIGLIPEF